ncbi:MAG: phospholipid-binding protein MlaC [Alphaproteobacteria bacterium]
MKSLIAPLILIGLLTVNAPAAHAEATPEDLAEAGSMIQTLGDEAIAVLNDPNTTDEAQAEAFRDMMRDALNLDYLARLALGRHWRTASPEERSAYLDVFDDYLLYTVTSRLTSEELVSQVVTSQLPAGKRDIFVDAEVTGAGEKFDVRWRLRRFDNGLKIINLQLETFSMMITTREEFAAVVSDKGMSGLVDAMLTKIEKMKSQT